MEEKETKQLSYEELKNVAVQLQQRAMIAEQKLKSVDMTGMRLHYLFEVLKIADKYVFPDEFLKECSEEVMNIMTIKEEDN